MHKVDTTYGSVVVELKMYSLRRLPPCIPSCLRHTSFRTLRAKHAFERARDYAILSHATALWRQTQPRSRCCFPLSCVVLLLFPLPRLSARCWKTRSRLNCTNQKLAFKFRMASTLTWSRSVWCNLMTEKNLSGSLNSIR